MEFINETYKIMDILLLNQINITDFDIDENSQYSEYIYKLCFNHSIVTKIVYNYEDKKEHRLARLAPYGKSVMESEKFIDFKKTIDIALIMGYDLDFIILFLGTQTLENFKLNIETLKKLDIFAKTFNVEVAKQKVISDN